MTNFFKLEIKFKNLARVCLVRGAVLVLAIALGVDFLDLVMATIYSHLTQEYFTETFCIATFGMLLIVAYSVWSFFTLLLAHMYENFEGVPQRGMKVDCLDKAIARSIGAVFYWFVIFSVVLGSASSTFRMYSLLYVLAALCVSLIFPVFFVSGLLGMVRDRLFQHMGVEEVFFLQSSIFKTLHK